MDTKLTLIKIQTFENKTNYEKNCKLKILITVIVTYYIFIKYITYILYVALLG